MAPEVDPGLTGASEGILRDPRAQAEACRRLLDTASVLGAVGDFNGRFLLVSEGWRDQLGHSPDRLVGTEYLKLVHGEDLERAALLVGELMSTASGMNRTIELRIRAHDGSFRWVSFEVRADHETRRIYGIGQDITERRLMDEALHTAEERLRLLAAQVSEQIRTPMNGIVGMTSLALATELTIEQQNYLAEVQRSAQRLLDIVAEMLDITKLEPPRSIDSKADAGTGRPIDAPATGGKDSADANPSLGLQVLLAEDDEVNALVATRMLERLGCSVVAAGTGRRALELLAAMQVDLVLMDLRMPEVDGLEATRTLRERERGSGVRRTPVIAVTADAMNDDQARCVEAGMDGFLAKPITLETLEREIRRVFIAV